MKTLIAFIGILLISSSLFGQNYKSLSVQIWPESDTLQKSYTLTGFRHGVSFFPKVKYSQVQYKAGESLTFDRYHAANVIYTWLERWAAKYPNLVDLYEVGKSYEGRPIIQITITNKKTGKDTDKPAAFFEGGMHSVEVTGTECVLYLANYLLEKYGKDPDVTHLLDTKTIYLRPINNPDGHNLIMNTFQINRSTVKPEDDDGDGLLDEDPLDDINGDGLILNMRWKDEKKGNYIPDPRDPTGRILKQVPAGQGIYLTEWEGIDNDGDGTIDEDGIGGLDLNRNFPENWRPKTEATGRGNTEWGPGDYPLSETETRAVVTFLLSHPNVYVVNSMHTNYPMHLRPPSTSPSSERMYPEDLNWYKLFDELGKKITGYAVAGDVFDSLAHGNPYFGHGPDFGYWYFGAIWYCDEIWNRAQYKDYNGDGTIDEIDMLKWNDEENDSVGFFNWKPAKHPVYGDIEMGGFDIKFFLMNPPIKHLKLWIENEALFDLEMTKSLPELVWENIEVKKIKSYKTDSADYQLKVSFKNIGKLPTALKQAHLVKIVKDDKVVVNFDSINVSGEKPKFKVLPEEKPSNANERQVYTIQGESVSKIVADTQGGAITSAIFKVRIYKSKELTGKANVFSTRGGVLRDKEFSIK
jgi:Zinc carboxypeptidase